ncbi:MAG: hypothetical protein Q4F71_00580 [Paracoccus sp. (in: a-proteobacteria)]|nr:hypothetical protein [Paracoccus sp. (in: a-proteobacteria)]
MAQPKSKEAELIVSQDLNEVITAYMQDTTAIERGMFDKSVVPEKLTRVWLGKIIRDKYPTLDDEDQEAVRQRAIAALNLTQQATAAITQGTDEGSDSNAFVDGVRRFAMSVTELEIDLIDRISPFAEAYAMSKTIEEASLKQVAAELNARRVLVTPEEARDLAKRALKLKQERGRLPGITSSDQWEKRMAEEVAFLARMTQPCSGCHRRQSAKSRSRAGAGAFGRSATNVG